MTSIGRLYELYKGEPDTSNKEAAKVLENCKSCQHAGYCIPDECQMIKKPSLVSAKDGVNKKTILLYNYITDGGER